jgi:asparagine N-glycosylation enzyme membrane subunit Stt3
MTKLQTNLPSKSQLERAYTNEGRSEVSMGFTEKTNRNTKNTDVLVFDRIGTIKKAGDQNSSAKGALLRGASNKLFTMLFRAKANSQDVYNIFRTAGMNNAQAKTAVSSIKQRSEELKLNGISAQAVKNELFFHEMNSKP